MNDLFQPIDLSAFYNAGTANASSEERGLLWPAPEERPDDTPLKNMLTGEREFWGLPFALGSEGAENTIVQVAQKAKGVPESVTIAVGATARRLLFAHACAPIKGEFATVEGTGEAIGSYKIVYADGTEIAQELRRRFEIHDTNVPWGHHPFLCRNCREFR